ncbi:MAG: helix-turn-helix domain-containing protein [Acidimicrobiales bacterium]
MRWWRPRQNPSNWELERSVPLAVLSVPLADLGVPLAVLIVPIAVQSGLAERGDSITNQTQPIRSRYLTVGEVAEVLRISSMTVYRLINAGQIPATRVGKSYRMREDDVDKFVADRYTQAG